VMKLIHEDGSEYNRGLSCIEEVAGQ